MAKAKVTLTLFFLFVALILFAITFQQYSSYLEQRTGLLQSDEQNRQLLKKIEAVLPQQKAFTKQLAKMSRQHERLRQQLPSEMQLDEFKRQIEKRFKAKSLKVLAQREASYNRSFYHEVRLIYSLKGSVTTVKRVLSQIKKQPRLVISKGAEKESKENTGLQLSIFSVPAEEEATIVIPECLDEPEGVWFPFLKEELELLYSDYSHNCQRLTDNNKLYRDMQRYRHLSKSVQFLENIRDTIRKNR